MSAQTEPLTPATVLARVVPRLQRVPAEPDDGPRCRWCHGAAVWTTGNKARCTVCGFVPS